MSNREVERWAPVLGHEGAYEVSDLGRVRSVSRIDGAGRNWPGRILSPSPGGGEGRYLKVSLSRAGRTETHSIHRLVLRAFAGEPGVNGVVRHLNGISTDNRLVNMCWGTQTENNLDIVRHGRNRELQKTHCPSGHAYAGDNLRTDRKGHRFCRTCGRQKVNARRAALRMAELDATPAEDDGDPTFPAGGAA